MTNIPKKIKVLIILVSASLIIIVTRYLVSADFLVILRLLDFEETGNVSGRDAILEDYVPYIWNTPILGVGETGLSIISHRLYGGFISPHNEIVFLLLTTGCVGTFFMTFFWLVTFFRGIKSYFVSHNSVAALLIIPILAAILSQQILYEKFGWIVYAYLLTNYYMFNTKHTKKYNHKDKIVVELKVNNLNC